MPAYSKQKAPKAKGSATAKKARRPLKDVYLSAKKDAKTTGFKSGVMGAVMGTLTAGLGAAGAAKAAKSLIRSYKAIGADKPGSAAETHRRKTTRKEPKGY